MKQTRLSAAPGWSPRSAWLEVPPDPQYGSSVAVLQATAPGEASIHGFEATRSVLMVALVSTALAETATRPEDSAQRAAESWLTLADAGEGVASWEQAAKRLQGKVTKEQWKRALIQLRSPLGRVVSRQVKSRRFSEKVPGASDAPNVTIEFATVFEKRGPVVETITPMLEPDGVWRVAGYTIR